MNNDPAGVSEPNRLKAKLQRLMPAQVIQARLHRSAFIHVAEKIGLVYFGYVDQRSDDHRLVRGITTSTRQRDTNYCIGTFEGYDITLVERSTVVSKHSKESKRYNWLILSLDLHNAVDLPHAFLGLKSHGDAFYNQLQLKYPTYHDVSLSPSNGYSSIFIHKYRLFSSPSQALSSERLFSSNVGNTIAAKFGNISIEIHDSVLYLYAEQQRPSVALLEKMIQYGTWLAKTIDTQRTTT